MLNVVYALWVDDFGAFAERHKVRDAIDGQLAMAAAEVTQRMGVSSIQRSEEFYANAQRELMTMLPPARRREDPPTKEDETE